MISAPLAPAGGWVLDFMQHRLECALRRRVRYRYVQPRVLREGETFRIESPCCSRNVDPQGGVIDIALLTPGPQRVSPDDPDRVIRTWHLFARDHAKGAWVAQCESERIDELMDLLCVDEHRIYWP